MEIRRKARSESSVFKNNLTLKLSLSRIQVQGPLLAIDQREPDLPVPVLESLHEQTDEELTETDIKRMDADDQAIQTILLGLPKDVYAAVDSCETTKEIWERVRQMMKGLDIEEQEKKAKLFNE
nr:hypothetical protein [Tanacetum cinerariifolium]